MTRTLGRPTEIKEQLDPMSSDPMSRSATAVHTLDADTLTAELVEILSLHGEREGLPWETVEHMVLALVAVALEHGRTSEAVHVDAIPVRQAAAALRRTPEEVSLAILGTGVPGSDPFLRDLLSMLASDEGSASLVNDKVMAAARAANLSEEDFPDFYTEFIVAKEAVEHRGMFSEIPSPLAAGVSRECNGNNVASRRAEFAAARTGRALELRQAGATLAEIGSELGVTRERVRQILRTVDAPSAEAMRAKWSAARDAALQAVRDDYVAFLRARPPMTVSEAAEALGVDRSRFVETLDDTLRRMVLPDPKPSQARWSREEVMKVLAEAATLEYPLTAKGYARLIDARLVRGPSVPRIGQIFGTWGRACAAAGVEAGVRPRADYSSKWTDGDLVDAVRRYLATADSRTFGGYADWAERQDDRPSGGTIRNRLGRWNDILRKVHEDNHSERSARDQ